ncbi:NB-ARC, partial [Arabidopsis suecica]
SSSSSLNWVYDVFLSFRGEDVRVSFRSHFLKELDRKLITAFKDNEIKKSHSLWPELVQAIKESRIAVVVFSKNYASSSWCLNELLEIVNCNDKIVIPVFYGVDPSHVRNQTGDFGRIFEETCKKNTEEMKNQWKKVLSDVSNMFGFHSATWDNEAKMIEEIANDVLGKLLLTSSKDFENFVGIEDHIAEMSLLLQLESEEVRMVGIWGSSGIGKTTIARALFNQLSRHFQVSKFIDRAFAYKSREIYSRANPDDYNMKLHLQESFLMEILRQDIKIDHLGVVGERLQHQKVLIIVDDLDNQVILDSLVGQTQWFGRGSRIIVVTNDKHFLRARRIDHIYEVTFPTEVQAFQMLCQSAFRQNYAPEGFGKLVVDVARHAGRLPLGLNVLGAYLRGRDKEYWMDLLPRLQNGLDNKIEKILRISYDGLVSAEDQAIFRHIACLFNHMEVTTIKSLLADSKLSVNIGLQNLADKSLIHVRQGYVVMHRSLQEMGRKIVRAQSIDKPGKQEFLVDPNDICHVLSEGIGTKKVLGISFQTSEIDELHVHESAFKGMCNLRFLEIDSSKNFRKKGRLHLPKSFDYLPTTLKLLCWSKYPMSGMPSNFRPDNLVKLRMRKSKLHKLWEGVVSFTCLKEMDMLGSKYLKEIPDLSMATNLETLCLRNCESLVELPSSIRNLNKLLRLDMGMCKTLKILPTGFNLKSLDHLNLGSCSELRTFPELSTNVSDLYLFGTNIEEFPSNLHLENLVSLTISNKKSDGKQWEGVKPFTPFMAILSPTLTHLWLDSIPSLVELPSSFQNLNQLKKLTIRNCRNLKTLPTGINLLSLDDLDFNGCQQLRSFPEISTNILRLELEETGIEEVPWWIEKFSNLTRLNMGDCSRLKCVSLNISKLKHLGDVSFSNCAALTRVDLSGYPSLMEMMEVDNISEEASSSLPDSCVPKVDLNFMDCFNLDPETVLDQQSNIFNLMVFSGEEVPSYFTHRTTGVSSLTIPLSQPFFRFRVGAVLPVVDSGVKIKVNCEFKGRFGNNFYVGFDFIVGVHYSNTEGSHMLTISDCCIPLNEDNAPLAQGNYDHVDMEINTSYCYGNSSGCVLKGWGIRLLEDCSSPENNLLGNPITLPLVCEDNILVKSGDTNIETERSMKRMWASIKHVMNIICGNRLGDSNNLPHVCEAEDDKMGYTPLQRLVNETEHTEESGDGNVEAERSSKRMRV